MRVNAVVIRLKHHTGTVLDGVFSLKDRQIKIVT